MPLILLRIRQDVELLYNDFKEFRISGTRIAIAQVQCKKDDYFAIKDHFHAFMEETAEAQHYDLVLTLFTDPMGSGSYFLPQRVRSLVSLQKLLVIFSTKIILERVLYLARSKYSLLLSIL